MKTYETDVLVVGGGGAATASTISAHEGGAKTMLAVKGQFGVPGKRGAGATSNPLADFWTIRTVGKKGGWFNPPEAVHRDMLQAGLGMADPALCQIFVDEVSDALKRLMSMGMKFQSKMLATMPANKETKTNHIVAIQKAVIQATNTQVVEQANLTDVVVEDGHVVGAVGVHDDGEPFFIRAGAVILATGGVGQLFQYSFNPPGNTGDGYAMALRAGAELFNMEFMQQGLATTWPRQAMVMLYEMEEPYKMYNAHGQRFLENYLPEGKTLKEISDLKAFHWPVSCRDDAIHLDRAIHGEAIAGRATEHDGVLLDLQNAERGFQPEMFIEYMNEVGIDVNRDLIQVQLHHHTSNGGVRIDTNTMSGVHGLFACGETSGWQGADRLGGTMLGGSQVFGWRAGKNAAEIAKHADALRMSTDSIRDMVEAPKAKFKSGGKHDIGTLKKKLQRMMWMKLLVDKDAKQLAEARQFVADERDRLENDLALRDNFDIVLAFEHKNLLDVAEVIIETADTRKESRGSHYRGDFPERDDKNFLTSLMVSRKNGELAIDKRWINEGHGWEDREGDIRIQPWG